MLVNNQINAIKYHTNNLLSLSPVKVGDEICLIDTRCELFKREIIMKVINFEINSDGKFCVKVPGFALPLEQYGNTWWKK